ncbi:MAG: cyanophycin synthetase [Endozoicomonas sp. (ex Botrylloides leachii)]|nr:cyanophycin synthetase [Endozoicomonas sp. (ex Botrylloides leachii)]
MIYIKKLIYQCINSKLLNGCTNFNPLEVRKSCRSKKQAREAFARHNIPHSKGVTFINPWKAHLFAKKHGFPLVIKPNVGGFSRGSYFPIHNFWSLWKAMFLAKIWWPVSVVEQYLEGKNYRVLVADGRVISVIQRYAPFVIGNGVDSISALIDKENNIRNKMGLHQWMYPLQKKKKTQSFLARQGLSINSIPDDRQRILLFHRVALPSGGIIETVEKDKIPTKNILLMEKILHIFDANILGIDIIMEKGIEHDYDAQKSILLEVNSRPCAEMHHYPRYGERDDISGYLNKLSDLHIKQTDIF